MILVTVVPAGKHPGASPTEPIGRCLVDRLIKAGEQVRVLAERPQTTGWPDGVEVVEGSITRPSESLDAFRGIKRVFLAGASPKTVREFLDQAQKGGVRRIVVLSSHGPEYEIHYPPETWHWLAIERAVEESGAEWAHIRPSAVMASTLTGCYPATGSAWVASIRTEGVIREPYIQAAYPFIDEGDLAGVAAAALLEDGYTGQIVEAGGANISAVERVRIIGETLGREIRLQEITPNQARELWRSQGWPEETIEVTLYALSEFGAHPAFYAQWTAENADPTIKQALGRSARTYAQWVADHVEDFR
ncbi:NAD(P)H-binding protein [Paenibacillus harenae]|uniref:NAD(P)H-binding protein n=1 Tax=Paenibacillus harenae TaxID=306543 RepID=UPI000425DE1B|nr:NAD(P)H-binding protein [Paenibacillus harenae]